jgi:hypothetical protein
MVGLNNSDYPAFLSGAGNPIGVVFPRAILAKGSSVEYTMLIENLSGSGSATFYILGRIGGTPVIFEQYTMDVSPGYLYCINWGGRTIPNVTGNVLLLGIAVLGSSTDIYYNFLYIQ